MSEFAKSDEVLLDQALWGFEDPEEQDLRELLTDTGLYSPGRDFERAAAAATWCLLESKTEQVPSVLLQKLHQQVRSQFRGAPAPAPAPNGEGPGRSWSTWALLAACLLMSGLLVWQWAIHREPGTNQRFDQVKAAAGSLVLSWSKSPAAKTVELFGEPTGEVVWDQTAQVGFMRFRGLRPLDPSKQQYQLWIFDGKRDEARPVDGGAFDLATGTADVTVAIRANIKVFEPTLFAVTVEKAGGVMVSKRQHIVALAKVK